MSRFVLIALSGALLALAGFTLFETRRLAEQLGRAEIAVRDAEARLPAALQQVEERTRERDVLRARVEALAADQAAAGTDAVSYAGLRLELETTRARLQAVETLLEQRNEDLRQRALAAAAANERSAKPVPEGVRAALDTLHGCLRDEGFEAHRFLSASRLDDGVLHDVELLERAADGLQVVFVTARTMTAVLDRARGRLSLRFADGERTADGQRMALPKDGLEVAFEGIDGRPFEARLPFLIKAEGAYPATEQERERAAGLDPFTARQWRGRLDDLLAKAGTPEVWRVTGLRGMRDGWFLGVDLVASDAKHSVVAGAHGDRAAIEVDAQSGVVSLRLVDGVLLRDGAESSIRGEGYRMLLPNLTPAAASRAMQGMVVAR